MAGASRRSRTVLSHPSIAFVRWSDLVATVDRRYIAHDGAPAPGPYSEVPIDAEHSAPFYILRFDKRGRPEGPATLKHLMDALVARRFTDVYVFSHGWNDEWHCAPRATSPTAPNRAASSAPASTRARSFFVRSRSVAEANVRSCIGCKQKLAGVHLCRRPWSGGAGPTQIERSL